MTALALIVCEAITMNKQKIFIKWTLEFEVFIINFLLNLEKLIESRFLVETINPRSTDLSSLNNRASRLLKKDE